MSALGEFQLETSLHLIKENHDRIQQLEAETTKLRRITGTLLRASLDLVGIVHPDKSEDIPGAIFEETGIDVLEQARYETARMGGEINWLLNDPEEINEPDESAPIRRNGNGKRKALGKTLGEINESTQRKATRKRK